jgi:hypothetical protein
MAGKSPQERLNDVVLSAGAPALADFAGEVIIEPWMIAELRAAEASIRCLRREMEEHLAGAGRQACAGCGRTFTATRSDARYCSGRCRQAALRVRRSDS